MRFPEHPVTDRVLWRDAPLPPVIESPAMIRENDALKTNLRSVEQRAEHLAKLAREIFRHVRHDGHVMTVPEDSCPRCFFEPRVAAIAPGMDD